MAGCTGEIRNEESRDDEGTNSNGISGDFQTRSSEPAVQTTPLTRSAAASWAWRGRHRHYGGSGGTSGTSTGTGGTNAGSGGISGSAGMAGTAGMAGSAGMGGSGGIGTGTGGVSAGSGGVSGGTGGTHAGTGGVSGGTGGVSGGTGGTTGGTGGTHAGTGGTSGGTGGVSGGTGGVSGGTGGVSGGTGGTHAGTGGTSGGTGGVSGGTGGVSGGTGGTSGGTGGTGGGGACFNAKRLWFDDMETGDLSRWTSKTYNNNWGDNCQSNGFSTESAHSPTHSLRSEIVCPYTGDIAGGVQRGYGGIQMSGDNFVPAFTNTGTGVDAPNGIVTVMWMRMDSPTVFQNGKWVSFWTASASCDWSDEVLTLGIEDSSGRLAAAHYSSGGGSRTFDANAPAVPRGTWTRITVYANYYDGVMHVWQDGKSVEHVTFTRAIKTICQFHWGLYASADNDNIVLFEDDKSLWKLNAKWTDFTKEPNFGDTVTTCN